MIKWMICLLWGHKTVHKAYTGEKMKVTRILGNSHDVPLYRYEKTDFCIRCGKIAGKE